LTRYLFAGLDFGQNRSVPSIEQSERRNEMTRGRGWSNRWRVAAPLAAASALALRRLPAIAQEATPPAGLAEPFASMLGLIPASATGSAANVQLATFADLAAQLDALGIAAPAVLDDSPAVDEWLAAVSPLAIADPFANFARVLGRDFIGYDLAHVDQTIQAGDPPDVITLLRGRFDHDAVAAAWTKNGYKLLKVDGVRVASLSEDESIDFNNPINKIVLARMNNAAFLSDGTLAYTARLDRLQAVIAAASVRAPALAARADVVSLISGIDRTLSSAMLLSGVALSATAQNPPDLGSPQSLENAFASVVAASGTMPPIQTGLFGQTPGGPLRIPVKVEGTPVAVPSGEIVFELLLAEPGSAEQAKEVVEQRLPAYRSTRTRAPLSDYFASWKVRAIEDRNVLEIDFTPNDDRPIDIWVQMIANRDLGFLAW
jgi:hypothetical protein